MQQLCAPVRKMAGWPDSFPALSEHLDLASKGAGIIGWGATLDAPEENSMTLARPKEPFLLVREETGDSSLVPLHSDRGRDLLGACTFAAELLLSLTDESAVRLMTSELTGLYWSENEDVSEEDAKAYGLDRCEVHDIIFVTDGRAITAWNSETDLIGLVKCHVIPAEDDEEEDDDLDDIEDHAAILIPAAHSAHEVMESVPVLWAHVAILNELAFGNEADVALACPTLFPKSAA